jgi:hydrogenase maturation factor
VKTGKLAPETLRRLVLGKVGVRRADVIIHAGLGEDAAAVRFGDEACVLSSDPITGAGANAGWYAVHVACNDIAAMGARPVGVLATLIFPESAEEDDVATVVDDIDRAAHELGIEVLGGHTEVAPGLTRPIIAMTSVGRVAAERLISSGGGREGDALLLTKTAAIEGSAILATDLAHVLAGRVAGSLLAEARACIERLSVVPDGIAAAGLGATALHDPTEGGVLGGLWEMAEAAGLGFELWADAVPLLESTRAICAALDADPLGLISSGAMLVACPDAEAMVAGLARVGVAATPIGTLTRGDRLVVRGGVATIANPSPRDELWRLLELYG